MSRSEGKSLKVQHVPRDDGTVEVFIPERGEKYRYNMPKARPREPLANYKLADVHEMYQRCYQEFDSSDFCTDLHKLVSDKLLNLEQLALDRVVCTGIGSFCGIPGPQLDEVSSNPCLQLAVLEHMIQWLAPKFDIKEKEIFFQDPAFNEVDKAFLKDKNFTVVINPEAYNLMTPETIFYAPGNFWEVVYHGFEVAYPGLYIGNDLARYNPQGIDDDPGSSGERMQQDSSTVQDVEKLWAKHTLIPHSDECTPQAEAVYWRAGPR